MNISFRKAPPVITEELTETSLRKWLVEMLALRLSHNVNEIDTSRTFDEYGLDSRAGIQISGQLEKILERRLSPALLFNYPSIDGLVEHLTQTFELPRQG